MNDTNSLSPVSYTHLDVYKRQVGVWIAMIIDWVCRSAFFVGRFVSGKWKTKYKA